MSEEKRKQAGGNTPAFPAQDMMSFFPINESRPSARPRQREALECIEALFKQGTKVIVIEGPVGSGKSAMAVTMAKYFGDAHILTPRKALQDQYMEDFPEEKMACMKGRSSYPCLPDEEAYALVGARTKGMDSNAGAYAALEKSLIAKEHDLTKHFRKTLSGTPITCSTGRCSKESEKFQYNGRNTSSKKACQIFRMCPYSLAGAVANDTNIVVHNLTSFMYQNLYASMFPEPRSILIIDEAHDLEGTIRDFASAPFNIYMDLENLPRNAPRPPAFGKNMVSEWASFLSWEGFIRGDWDEEERELWQKRVQFLTEAADTLFRDTITYASLVVGKDKSRSHQIHIVPLSLNNYPNDLFFQYAERVVLMSGTIYDKAAFCQRLGIKNEDAAFIRIPSEFPVSTRPIHFLPDLVTNNGHASWSADEEEYLKMVENIEEIMMKHSGVKGLIHAPSYFIASQLALDIRSGRIISHDQNNFAEKLQEFYAHRGNAVFLSPVCQQGVDFKYDRARFQMILRVPYPSVSNPFIKHMSETNFKWYNLQALITFGQMVGRVNRAADDYGETYLLDSRFRSFLRKNVKNLPKWQRDSIRGVYDSGRR